MASNTEGYKIPCSILCYLFKIKKLVISSIWILTIVANSKTTMVFNFNGLYYWLVAIKFIWFYLYYHRLAYEDDIL